MNRRVRQLLTGFMLISTFAVTLTFQTITAYAGSAKISFSDPKASVGQEFNVSVKITASEGDLGAADVVLSYDPSYIEFISGNNANGGAGSVRIVGTMDSDTTTVFSYNLKFKAIQAGDSAISVASYEVYDKDTQAVDVTKVGSSSVKVAAPSNYSKEAGLSSLKVSPGSLNPAFSADVTSYTVSVGGDVSRISVSAAAKDGKAKVAVSGDSDLKAGANSVICKVTAEDGKTVRSYKITVNKSETAEAAAQPSDISAQTEGAVLGELKADIDGTEYSVATSFDPAALPQGYTQSTCTYNGSEIMSGTGNDLTLIYLQSAEGTGSFFIYNPGSGALSPYVTIEVTAKAIVVLPIDDTVVVPSGFAETTIQLNGDFKVKGWVWQSDEEQRYCVVYGMNENGDKALYRYDIAEKTFQRYFEDPAVPNKYDDAQVEDMVNKYDSLLKDYNLRFIIMIALIVISLILFFIVVNLLLKKKERPYPGNDRYEEKPTPVKRRTMEQNMGGSRQVSQNGRNGSGSEDRSRPNLSVYETRSNAEPRVRKEAPRQVTARNPYEADTQRDRHDYTIRHEDRLEEERRNRPRKQERISPGEDMPVTLNQREAEREERARQARERLERERREDERRRYDRQTAPRSGRTDRNEGNDDLEFMDLDE